MKYQKQVIIIVGAYSSGYKLAPAFLGRGYQCIHIDVSTEIAANYNQDNFFSHQFSLNSEKSQTLDTILEQLKAYSIKAVIAASEWGVLIADEIAAYFNVPQNCIERSIARRHKFHMIDALRKANVPCAKQFHSQSLEEIIGWYRLNNIKKVVMKPPMGAYSDGVGICQSEAEIKSIFNKNINQKNFTGDINDEYVIQEYLDGQHFVVNAVSVDGLHFITDIWEDINHHEGTYLIDEYSELLSRDDINFQILADYTYKSLNALGIRNGPSHSEVKLTSDGPKLIETGARLAGGLDFSVVEEGNGFSQLSLTIDSILNPDLFIQRINLYQQIKSKKIRFIYMFSEVEGKITKSINLDIFKPITGIMSINFLLNTNDSLGKTKFSVGHPGYAMILRDNTSQLDQDYQQFRQVEAHFFQELI